MSGLLLIRHAETDMAGTFCGHSDPPVNDRGKQQILDLVARVGDEAIDEVYSSDLLRAIDTAMPVAQIYAAPVRIRRSLREIYFGDWEGLTWTDIERRDPHYAKRWAEEFPMLPAPGGELFADFHARVVEEIEHLLPLAKEKNIAVVTHGGVMRIALRALNGCSEQEAWEQTSSYCCSFACKTLCITMKEDLTPAPTTGD